MDEREPGTKDRKQRLLELLTADFESPERKQAVGEATRPLARLLAHARDAEEVDRRYGSADSQAIGHEVDALVGPARVSKSFKMFITDSVRRAHAFETTVDRAVAPDRLGLQSGDGIFDPDQAQQIEAHVLRGAVADAMRRFYIIPETETGEELEPLMVGRPKDFRDWVFTLGVWEDDYRNRYGGDEPFAGMEAAAFWAAARRAVVASPVEFGDEPGPAWPRNL